MSAAHAYDRLHHLVDRLPPEQAHRLLHLVEHDPELAAYDSDSPPIEGKEPAESRLASAGVFASERGDLSERVDEIIAERFNYPV
jgi:hypothetical protein